jgi:Flp pilus assembly protein TadG
MNCMRFVKGFLDSTKGTVAIMMAATIPAIMLLASIALEISRHNYVESKLAFAADAAAIAGAKYDISNVQANALQVFNANFPPGTNGISPIPTVSYDATTKTVDVKVNANLPTLIGGFFGQKFLAVKAESQVIREFGGLELAMVLDITGSMAQNNKIGGLITAANNLVDTIYEGQNTRDNTAIGIVPFVTIINVGSNNTAWLTDPATVALFPASQPWQGCIMAKNALEFDDEDFDTPPPAAKWPTYFVASTIPSPNDDCVKRDNDWWMTNKLGVARKCPAVTPTGTLFEVVTPISGINVGPNRSCGPPIMPLHNNAADIKAYISKLTPTDGGGTMGNIGLVWGGRVLSEFWTGLWTVKQASGTTIVGEPIKKYTEPTNTKAIIMMTDGGSNWYDGPFPPNSDPTSYGTAPNDRYLKGKLGSTQIGGIGTTNPGDFTLKINDKISRLCTGLKAKGIEIYTITFRVTDPSVNQLYQNCATTPDHFAAATDNASILAIFTSIAQQLKRLRIVA